MWVFALTRSALLPSLDYSGKGEIGDTIGGLTAPVIGVIAAITTFLAFYMQYLANLLQSRQFKVQSDERMREKHEGRILFLIQQNRNIVDQMYLSEKIKGIKCFTEIFHEFRIVHRHAKSFFRANPAVDSIQLANIAFTVVFHGVSKQLDPLYMALLGDFPNFREFLSRLRELRQKAKEKESADHVIYFNGHQTRLGQYFRNLFHIVNYVRNVDEELLSPGEKVELVKVLRSQMSNPEQIIVLANSMSFYGKRFFEEGFLRDYRLVHNIPLPMLQFLGDISKYTDELEFEWNEVLRAAGKPPGGRSTHLTTI